MNEALTDRESRVYMFIVLAFPEAEVDVPTLAAVLPFTEQQIGQAVGELVNHGLLSKRMRVVGYKPAEPKPLRIRRYFYRLAGGAA